MSWLVLDDLKRFVIGAAIAAGLAALLACAVPGARADDGVAGPCPANHGVISAAIR